MILRVRVQPRASKNALAGQIAQEWKLLLTAPPLRLPGAVGSPATPVATV